jgi:hypothetical protein
MALQFNPPDWAIQEYMNRKTPAQEASQGLQQGLQNYAAIDQMKRQNMMVDMQAAQMGYDPNNPAAYWERYNSDLQSKQDLRQSEIGKNNALADRYRNSQVAEDKKSPAFNKPPTGFRWTATGDLEPIPGGPAFVKTQETEKKSNDAAMARTQEAELVIGKIDSALSKVGRTSAGVGSYLAGIPGTKATDLESDLDTINSSLGLGKLMELKNNSKAGASGMGALSDKEMNLLISAVTSLKQKQSPDQLRKNLGEVKKRYSNVIKMSDGVNPYEGVNAPQGGEQEQDVIRVRNKQTGQTGKMPSSKFDPSKYEQL